MKEATYDDYDGDLDDDWDDYASDRCYECAGYGDDYFVNDDGEMECWCPYCWNNPNRWDDEDWDE